MLIYISKYVDIQEQKKRKALVQRINHASLPSWLEIAFRYETALRNPSGESE